MAIYVVMEPPSANADAAAEGAVLVRDGFSLIAFVAPVVWLLWYRLWIEAVLVFAVGVGLLALGETAGFGFAGAALSLLVSVFIGLEGQALRVRAFARRGWREWGVVEGDSVAEAEIRYLAGEEAYGPLETGQPAPAAVASEAAPRSVRTVSSHSGPALGLLGYPGRS